MSIIINNVFSGIDDPEAVIFESALKKCAIEKKTVTSCHIAKTSLDARRRVQPKFVSSVVVTLESEALEQQAVGGMEPSQARFVHEEPFVFPKCTKKRKIIIAGMGPAGLFAGLVLAENGYDPIILERGEPLERRSAAVEGFWKGGTLQPNSNVQFGEGGAGAFSDGKLTTRIDDPRCSFVLQTLVRHGAPADILRKAKPHVGTDKLRDVVTSMRRAILEQGGQVHFETALTGISMQNGRVTGVSTTKGEMSADAVILAVGHSARDTFEALLAQGIQMEPKAFSVGVRMEHPQKVINRGLYGDLGEHPRLPVGEYQLSHRKNGRGVYTFCMCPGGVVVPAATEQDGVVTNGMSYHARDGANANAGLVVGVSPEDFGTHPLDGVRFQQKLEREAFRAAKGNFQAPGCTVGFFLGQSRMSGESVTPSYARGVTPYDIKKLFPAYITEMLREGILRFGQKLPGFAMAGAYMTGVETRTSSPLRILRTEACQAAGIGGLYPCGEGAGYAGGIMSAAVDGLRCAAAAVTESL